MNLDLRLPHTGIPPFRGTIWVTPDILGPDDPSSFGSVTYTGRGTREIFDRRVNEWITVNAYLFDVRFGDRKVEWQFNPEFGSEEAARAEIDVFAPAIGRLPVALLSNVKEVEVNAGKGLFGGDPYEGSILIHTEDSLRYHDRVTGELLRTTGGEGEGPGGYQFLSSFHAVGERLYTFDLMNLRLTVLDLAGAVEKTVTIQPRQAHSYPDVLGVFTDGSMLVASSVQ